MKKNLFKKSMSVLLSVLMLMSCWVWIAPTEAEAISGTVYGAPALNGSHYNAGTTNAYGTPVFDGNTDRWFLWQNGDDWTKVFYPSQIYLDVTESLEGAGYYWNVQWHFGDTAIYRTFLGANIWGDHSQWTGKPERYYTMNNIFSNYSVDASLPDGYYGTNDGGVYGSNTGSSSNYDLRIIGYGYNGQGSDQFSYNNTTHTKYISFRTRKSTNNATIYLKGNPAESYVGTTNEYNTSGDSFQGYGYAQKNGSTHANGSNVYYKKGDDSSYREGEWIEMQWFVTVYDKQALNNAITKSNSIYSQNEAYANYITTGLDNYVAQHQAAPVLLKTRATNQTALDNQTNALESAAEALRFAASNAELLTAISQAEAILNSNAYTKATKDAVRTVYNNAVNSSYDNGVTSYAIDFTDSNTWNAGKKADNDQKAIDKLTADLNAAIAAAENRCFDVTYENMFFFTDWAESASSVIGTPAKGTMTYDVNVGTITVNNNGANTQTNPNDHYTSYGFGNGHYNMTLVPGETYTFEYTTSGGSGDQVHIFFYDDNGNAVANKANGGNPFAHAYGTGRGTHTISFTAPENATKASFRFGSTVLGDSITFSNIFMYSHTRGDYADIANWTNRPNRAVFEYNQSLGTELDVPERTGYTFDGWWVDSINVNGTKDEGEQVTDADGKVVESLQNFGIAQNWNLYSEWTENTYNIEFNANGGTGTTAGMNDVLYSAEVQLTSNGFAKDGYSFKGWSTDKNATTVAYADGATVSKLSATDTSTVTLYAVWDINSYTVTFEKKDGTTTSASYPYGTAADSISLPANTTAYNDANGHHTFTWPTISNVTGNVTYKEVENTVAHTFDQQVVTDTYKATDATCQNKATYYYSCACGEKGTQTFASGDLAAHTPGSAATCTAAQTCTVCGTELAAKLPHTEETVAGTPATCTAPGKTEGKKCSVCGTTIVAQEDIPALGHSWTNADCDTPKTCSVCGATEGDALGHKWNDATCTAPKTCSVCGATEGAALGHKYEAVVTKPTCTDGGYTTYTCSVCKDSYVDDEVAALEHDWSEWKVETPATCVKEGTEKRTCNRDGCGVEETQAIKKLDHSYTGDYKWNNSADPKTHSQKCVNGCEEYGNETACTFKTEVIAPTCLNGGKTIHTCTVCTNSYDSDYTSALNHDYKYATGNGTSHDVTCSRCDYTATENCSGGEAFCNSLAVCEKCSTAWGALNADNHASTETYKENEKTENCLENGYTGDIYHKCCNTLKEKGTVISALGHTFGAETAYKAPTCSATGNEAYKSCTACNKFFAADAETNSIDVKDSAGAFIIAIVEDAHKWDEGKVTTEPTCTTKGVKTYTCKYDNSHTREEEVAALNHIDEDNNGYCDRVDCNALICDHIGQETVLKDDKGATCLEGGYTGDKHCAKCDVIVEYGETIAALGHDEVSHEAKAPTCTEIGWDAYVTCSRCDYTTYKEIASTGHDYKSAATAPTCTEEGYTTYTCSKCGDSYVADKVDALGHKEETIPAVDATCEDTGLTEGVKCSVCGEILKAQEEVTAKGHDMQETAAAVEPTCTEAGKTAVYTCANGCGKTEGGTEVKPLGHDEVSHEAKTPTCTENGWDAYVTCSRCDYTTYVEKAKLGHDEVSHEAKAPTCTENGWDAYVTCSRCDYTTYKEIASTGHDYKSAVTAPTCTEEGYTTYTCSKCGDSYVADKVDALGHKEETIPAVDATCEDTGLTEGVKCSVCGEILKAQEEVTAKGHDMQETAAAVEPTCTEAGKTAVYTCANGCGKTEGGTEVKPLGHDEVSHEAKAPTCTENGWDAYVTCSRCDYTTYKEIASTGHDYKSAVTAPTCTEEGYTTYTCSKCGDSYVADKVDALGHKEETISAVDATCEGSGLTEGVKCSVCGEILKAQEEIKALGHEYKTEITTEPTCTREGLKTYTCQRDASHTYTEVLPVISHVDDNNDGYCDSCGEFTCRHEKIITVNENPATCEFEGYSGDKVCDKCGLTVSKGEAIEPYGHSFGSTPVEVIEATCLNGKTVVYKCRHCTETQTKVVSAVGPHHIVVVDDTEPTCDKPGYFAHFCLTCHETVEVIEVAPTGHVDENKDGKCDVFGCGGAVDTPGATKKCTCLCHNENFFMRFIYKIIRFFWKLFGISKVCDCGAVHY